MWRGYWDGGGNKDALLGVRSLHGFRVWDQGRGFTMDMLLHEELREKEREGGGES